MTAVLMQSGVLLFGMGFACVVMIMVLVGLFKVKCIQNLFAPHWDELAFLIANWHCYNAERQSIWKLKRELNQERTEELARTTDDEERSHIQVRYNTRMAVLADREQQNEARVITLADGLTAVALSIGVAGRLIFAGLVLGLIVYGLISIHPMLPHGIGFDFWQ